MRREYFANRHKQIKEVKKLLAIEKSKRKKRSSLKSG